MDWVVLGHSTRRHIFGESNEVTTDNFILFIQFFTCKCKELNSSKQVKHTKHVSLPPVLLVHWPEGSSRSGERSRCDRLHRRDAGREGERHHRSGHLCSDESHRRYAAPHTVTGFLCAHESWNVELLQASFINLVHNKIQNKMYFYCHQITTTVVIWWHFIL